MAFKASLNSRTRANSRSPRRAAGRASRPFRPFLEMLEERLAPAVVAWDGGPAGTGTDWNGADNWAGDLLPTANDDAQIGTAFAGITITHATATTRVRSLASEASLRIDSGTFTIGLSGTGTPASQISNALAINGGSFTLSNATLNGPGTVTNAATMTLANFSTINAPLVNQDLLLVPGGGGSKTIGGAFQNAIGSTLRLLVTQVGTGSPQGVALTVTAGFTNHGTIELTSTSTTGNGPATLIATNGPLVNAVGGEIKILQGTGVGFNFRKIDAPLDNRGTLTLVDQNLTLQHGGAQHTNSGTIRVAGGDFLVLQQGTAPSFTNTGTITIDGGRKFTVQNGTFNQASGAINGAGALELFGFGTYNFATDFSNAVTGLLFSGGDQTVNGPGTLTNAPGKTLTLPGNTTINAPVVNQGLLVCFAGTQTFNGPFLTVPGSTLQVGRNVMVRQGFTNNGTIELTSFAVNVPSELRTDTGPLINAPGREIKILNGMGGAGRSILAELDNRGTLTLVDHDLIIPDNSTQHKNSGLIQVHGGNLRVTGNAVTFTNTGTFDVAAARTLDLSGVTLTNFSASTLTGGTFHLAGTLKLRGTAATVATNAAAVELDGPASGIVNQLGANALADFATNTAAGSFALLGGRNLTTAGNFQNQGRLTLGAASTMTVSGAYTQGADATLEVLIGGTPASGQFGRLVASGNASLDGTLDVRLVNGFNLAAGDSFTVMTYASHTSTFAAVTGLTSGRTPAFSAVINPADVVLTTLLNAANLDVETITVPATAIPGQNVTIPYTVRNLNTAAAVGGWVDSVYLSSDTTLAPGDKLIGRVTHTGGVSALGTYSETLIAPLPDAAPGTYHVIVVADSRGLVFDIDRSDNTAASAGTLTTDVQVLAVGASVAGALADGQDRYFRVDVPAGAAVRLTADFTAGAQAEFYVRYGDMPNRATFDQVFPDVFGLRQDLLLTGTAGAYYILLHGREGAGAGLPFSLRADLPSLEVRGASPATGGNTGSITTTLTGSGFSPATLVSLIDVNGIRHDAAAVTFRDNNTLIVTFDLIGLPAGLADIQVEERAASATADNAFTISTAAAGRLEVRITTPSVFRGGRGGNVTVEYYNAGGTDVPAPLLIVSSDNALLRLPEQPIFSANSVQVLGINPSGPAGVLSPGARGRFTVAFVESIVQAGLVSTFFLDVAGPAAAPIDWASLKDSLRPTLTPADAWDAIFANFTARVGATVGEYQAALGEAATYLSNLGSTTSDVSRLLDFLFQQADNAYPRQALASSRDAAATVPGLPLAFDRVYGQPISSRYLLGALGRGWTHTWDVSAATETNGDVLIRSAGSYRFFKIQRDGSYRGTLGDAAVLTRVAGHYELRETDGTLFTFQPDSLLGQVRDTNGNSITLEYTTGRLTRLVHSSGSALLLGYNAQGRISRITDAVGRITTYTYDAAGEHLLRVTDPAGTTVYTYASGLGAAREHALLSITSPAGTHVNYSYDALGRLIHQERDGGAEAVTYRYPGHGVVETEDATGAKTTAIFDVAGQLRMLVDALGRVQRFVYDGQHRLIEESTGGISFRNGYDNRGNLISRIDPLGQDVQFEYDPVLNRLESFRDPNGNLTQYNRDALGNVLAVAYPDAAVEEFTYDVQGLPDTATTRRAQTTDDTYNTRGLLTRRDHTDGTFETYAYDSRDNLISFTDADGTTLLTYDLADRLSRITYPTGRFLDFTYDAGGRRTRMVDQDGFAVRYTYDAAGRLASATDDGGAPLAQYTYDAAGRLARKDLGNGTFTTYEYDPAGQLEHLINRAPDGSVNSRFDYTYDVLGRQTSVTTLDGTTTYGYDAIGQLTSVALPGGRVIQYAYDAAGNRLFVTDAGVTTLYTTNNLNQYTAVGPAAYAYDPDGNLIGRTEGEQNWAYQYDDTNRLVGVVTPAGTWSYEYDALGNRVAATRNGERAEYLVEPADLANVVGEYSAGGVLARYVHAGAALVSQVDAAGSPAYYDYDQIGSTAGLTGPTGSYVNSYSYLPFGEPLSATETVANPFTYVGQFGVMREGHELDFMRARFYAPTQGRFLNPDPIGVLGGSLNLYSYVSNAPVLFVDPSGLFIEPAGTGPNCLGGICLVPAMSTTTEKEFRAARERERNGDTPRPVDTTPNPIPGLLNPSPSPNPNNPTNQQINDALNRGRQQGGGGYGGNGGGGSNSPGSPQPPGVPGRPGGSSPSNQRRSGDPNEIVGPAGFGSQGFILPDLTLPYTIHFENMPTATAPAQEVFVTQQLDADLDFTTFEFGNLGFGDVTIPVPAGRTSFQTRFDARDSLGEFVDISASINMQTGLVNWTFRSIDPVTLDLPDEVLAGFLPPNQTPPVGEGFVTYFVRPKANSPTGTRIDAQASIVFDTNAPIATPAIFNTIDAAGPTSSVDPLPPITNTETFTVSWSGSDDAGGSGIASLDVFVSDNGGPFELWLDDVPAATTSGMYAGQTGHMYGFISLATDNVVHVQQTPTSAQATTTVASDTTAPVLSNVPSNQTVNATGSAGAVVTYTPPNATDNVDPSPSVSCDPASGSTFSIGMSTVTCTATDDAGNSSSASFTITVQDAIGPTIDRLDLVRDARGKKVTQIVLTFSEDLNETGAETLANYVLETRTRRRAKPVALRSAVYDAGTVTLTPLKAISTKKLATVFLTARATGTLTDASPNLNPLDGDRNGVPGGDFVRSLSQGAILSVVDELLENGELSGRRGLSESLESSLARFVGLSRRIQ